MAHTDPSYASFAIGAFVQVPTLVLRAPHEQAYLRNLIDVKSEDLGDLLTSPIEGNVSVRASQGLRRGDGIPDALKWGGCVIDLLEEVQSLEGVGVLFACEVGGEACLGSAHGI